MAEITDKTKTGQRRSRNPVQAHGFFHRPDILPLGQELSAKPFSLLSTNPRFLRTVVLKEDLPAMKDTAGRAGGLFMGRIILTGISQGKHKFKLEYPNIDGKTICMAICACRYEVEILYFENYGGMKDLQMKWEKHIGTWKGWV